MPTHRRTGPGKAEEKTALKNSLHHAKKFHFPTKYDFTPLGDKVKPIQKQQKTNISTLIDKDTLTRGKMIPPPFRSELNISHDRTNIYIYIYINGAIRLVVTE